MFQYLPSFGLILLISLLLSASLTPFMERLGLRLRVADRPGGRRQHGRLISRLGGVGMYVGFSVAVLATLMLPNGWLPPRLDQKELFRLAGLLLGTSAVFVFGLLDDRFEFPSRPQFAAQFLSSLIAIAFIIFIERTNNPFTNKVVKFAWPVVWALTIHMIGAGQYSVALLPVALLGATLGFLPFNFNPARVFMGSNGSYFLGWALAALGIIAGAKLATVLLVMGLPILDVAWLIFSRWRRACMAYLAGRDHLHYRLADMGLSQRKIVAGYYLFSAAFGVLALGLGSRLFKLVALLILTAAALAVIVWATEASERKKAC